jgi:hypothetical protein
MHRFSLPFLSCLISLKAAAAPPASDFIVAHCFECHDADVQKGGLDLTSLDWDLAQPANLVRWVKVMDRTQKGEMPPASADQPSAAERAGFVSAMLTPLVEADRARQKLTGRGAPRRLNRVEYETALADLFGRPFRIQSLLPEDARRAGLDTVGSALNMSSVQMEGFLSALDMVLDQATVLYPKPITRKITLRLQENIDFMQQLRPMGPYHVQQDGVALFSQQWHSHFRPQLEHYPIAYSGRYRVRVSAYAKHSETPIHLVVRTGGRGNGESDDVPKTLLGNALVHPGEPQVFAFSGELTRGQVFRLYPDLPPLRFNRHESVGKQHQYTGPAVVVQWIEVEGPLVEEWPPPSHKLLWSDVKTTPLAGAKPEADPHLQLLQPPAKVARPRMTRQPREKVTGNQYVYDPKQPVGRELVYANKRVPSTQPRTLALTPDDPKQEAKRMLGLFLPRAFRRQATEQEVERYTALAHRWIEQTGDFEDSMRTTYKAALTSPDFLFHPGTLQQELGSHGIANRLAFFLWNGLPDAQLLQSADKGLLDSPAGRKAEALRMLADSRAERFLQNFIGQWLDLRLLDFTVPDTDIYPEYDDTLRWSIEQETHAFFREMLRQDLPVQNILHSDFVMINHRLARHYDLLQEYQATLAQEARQQAPTELWPHPADRFLRVPLPANSPRGGVLTMASVLKVTANGSNTSPVVRGVWACDRILGEPPNPPPPGVPAIEPDIRGAVTVRQQLEQHRQSKSCAVCHAQFDPPGLALENFDVIGAWRANYRKVIPGLKNPDAYDFAIKRHKLFEDGLPVDAADRLPDGRAFADVRQLKQHLLSDSQKVTRSLLTRWIIYATGAPVSVADRAEVERILSEAKGPDIGFKTLLLHLIESPLFIQP